MASCWPKLRPPPFRGYWQLRVYCCRTALSASVCVCDPAGERMLLLLLFWDETHFFCDRMSVPYIRLHTDTAATAAAASGLVHKADTQTYISTGGRVPQTKWQLPCRTEFTQHRRSRSGGKEKERTPSYKRTNTNTHIAAETLRHQSTYLLAMPSVDIGGGLLWLGLPPRCIFTAPANGNGNGSSEGKGRTKFTVQKHRKTVRRHSDDMQRPVHWKVSELVPASGNQELKTRAEWGD